MSTHDTSRVDVQSFGRTIREFVYTRHPRALARAANQVGKTRASAYRGILFSQGKLGVPAPNVLAVLVADIVNVYGEFCAKIHEVMDPTLLDPRCRYIEGEGYRVGSKRAILFRNGSRWLFRTSEGQQIGAASFTADGGWIDEIPKREHYNEFVRGLASNDAPLWVSLTPIGRPVGWFWDRVEGDEEYRATEGKAGTPPEVEWRQFVAKLSIEECPWRSPESIANQIADTDPAERPQRIFAEWEGVTPDREFYGYGPDCEIDELPEMRVDDLNFGVWADHGERAGREFILLACWDRRTMYVIAEYVNTRPTTEEEDAEKILEMLDDNGVPWQWITSWVGDVNSSGKSVAGTSINERLARALAVRLGFAKDQMPIRITKPAKGAGSVGRAINTLNGALMRGQLKIHKRCTRLRYALQHSRGEKDLAHGIDALGYGAVPVLLTWDRPETRRIVLRGR